MAKEVHGLLEHLYASDPEQQLAMAGEIFRLLTLQTSTVGGFMTVHAFMTMVEGCESAFFSAVLG